MPPPKRKTVWDKITDRQKLGAYHPPPKPARFWWWHDGCGPTAGDQAQPAECADCGGWRGAWQRGEPIDGEQP